MTLVLHSGRVRALLMIPAVALAGIGMKAYAGPWQWWLNNWGASFAYEIFFMLLVFALRPKRSSVTAIAVGVCVMTVALEFLQLYHTPVLEALRATVIGRSLLGHAFTWMDLPAYPIGCLLGWFLLRSAVGDAPRERGTGTPEDHRASPS